MTESVMHEREPLLPGAHRVIRVLALGEGPYRGVLVANGDDLAISVDAASLAGWQGWKLAGADHIAAPIDLVRRRDGQDVLLPWCTERVSAFVARRHGLNEALTAGEVSTLAISLLRGLREAGTNDSAFIGDWWLTSAARPVFALGGGTAIEASAVVILESLRAQGSDRALLRILGGITEGLGDLRRATHSFDRWENELLEHAAPRPLRTGLYEPERAARLTVGGEREKRSQAAELPLFELEAERAHSGLGTLFEPIRRRLQDTWATVELYRDQKAMRRQGPVAKKAKAQDATPGPRRWGRPMIVGGLAAAAVVTVGVLWPTDSTERGGDAARADSSPMVIAEATAAAELEPDTGSIVTPAPKTATSAKPTVDATGQEPLDVVAELVSQAYACAEGNTDSCESAWYPIRVSAESGVIRGVEDGTPTLIEDYGDLAAVRWESSEDAAAQMLVLIRLNERWRIQDVYDVADPPSQ